MSHVTPNPKIDSFHTNEGLAWVESQKADFPHWVIAYPTFAPEYVREETYGQIAYIQILEGLHLGFKTHEAAGLFFHNNTAHGVRFA